MVTSGFYFVIIPVKGFKENVMRLVDTVVFSIMKA